MGVFEDVYVQCLSMVVIHMNTCKVFFFMMVLRKSPSFNFILVYVAHELSMFGVLRGGDRRLRVHASQGRAMLHPRPQYYHIRKVSKIRRL